MSKRHWAAHNLAARLLAGPWTRPDIAAGIKSVLGPAHPASRRALATRLAAFGGETPPAPRILAAYLRGSAFFLTPRNHAAPTVLEAPLFAPIDAFANLPIPPLATPGDLASWLNLTPAQLDWLSDTRRGHTRATGAKLQHYHYALIPKPSGKRRLLEAPKPRLKTIQRRILHEILNHVPVHQAAHGYVPGRSCLTGAQIHASEDMLATFDLAQFFPAIALPRIHGLFRALGYPWEVARHLAGLCTTATPAAIRQRLPDPHQRSLHAIPHLPQGAPTSPALANLLAFTLDLRLHGLARRIGANYTRYADDLAFSGPAKTLKHLPTTLKTILQDEGFALNPAKTRIMPRNASQRITGIIVNTHCNIPRTTYDALKATIHNCLRSGPASQNRAAHPNFRAHLEGRITWVEQINPPRAAKLRAIFEKIDWAPPATNPDAETG